MKPGLRAFSCALTILALGIVTAAHTVPASAGELIPHAGLSNSRHGDTDAEFFGGVALRGTVSRALKTEISVDYRNEERIEGDLNIRQWPVTASAWVTPVPTVYAGGGVGWYHTTLDYDEDLPFDDTTSQDFGVHVGGGLTVPVSEKVGVDLNGRYVFMDDIETEFEDLDALDPDFWRMSLGLSIGF